MTAQSGLRSIDKTILADNALSRRSGGSLGVIGPGIGECEELADLATFRKPDMDLVIWRRRFPISFATWLKEIEASCFPDFLVLVRPNDLRHALEPHLDECGMPSGDMRNLFTADIEKLVATFAEITRTDLVDVRLKFVNHDACWKFHRDCVDARLLTTYWGPATEWVQPSHAERALREQEQFKGPIERLGIHDVAIFKGNYTGSGSGIVHRSPPIAGTGRTRLLLCLNKRFAASPEPWHHGP